MSARRAYRFAYDRLVAPLDDDARLEIDAALGDPTADAEIQQRRRDLVTAMGGELA